MFKPLLVGNWKTGVSLPPVAVGSTDALALAKDIVANAGELAELIDLAVCPPFVYIADVKRILSGSGVAVGSQTAAHLPEDAQSKPVTGEVTPFMLRNLITYAIIGHSERLQHCGEDFHTTVAKFKALAAGSNITPVVCISESGGALSDIGKSAAQVREQVKSLLEGYKFEDKADAARPPFAIAYEPVWAIGGDKPASLEHVRFLTDAIRDEANKRLTGSLLAADIVPIIYGGSVSVDTAYDLATLSNVNGFLLGRASLSAEQFIQIGESTLKAHQSKHTS